MKSRLVSFALVSLAALALLPVAPAHAAATSYSVDAVHSTVIFRVKHMGCSFAYGRFNGIEGTVSYDAAAPASASIQLKVDATTIDTGNEKRDAHLKNPDLFDVAKFPEITFASTSVKKAGDNALDVTGDLTLHGVKKSITIRVDVTGTGKNRDGQALIGFESTFAVKRSDYGMSYGVKPDGSGVGDEVRLTVSLECTAK